MVDYVESPLEQIRRIFLHRPPPTGNGGVPRHLCGEYHTHEDDPLPQPAPPPFGNQDGTFIIQSKPIFLTGGVAPGANVPGGIRFDLHLSTSNDVPMFDVVEMTINWAITVIGYDRDIPPNPNGTPTKKFTAEGIGLSMVPVIYPGVPGNYNSNVTDYVAAPPPATPEVFQQAGLMGPGDSIPLAVSMTYDPNNFPGGPVPGGFALNTVALWLYTAGYYTDVHDIHAGGNNQYGWLVADYGTSVQDFDIKGYCAGAA